MGNALALVIAGGVFATGVLWHFNYFFTALWAGLWTCAAVRWIWRHYV
jgi:hypothetical protein